MSFIGGGGRKRLEKRTDGEKKESRKNRKWGKRRYGFLGFSFSFLLYGFGRDSRELKVEKYKMNIRLVTLKK